MSPEDFWFTTRESCTVKQCGTDREMCGLQFRHPDTRQTLRIARTPFLAMLTVLNGTGQLIFLFYWKEIPLLPATIWDKCLAHPCKIFWDQQKKNVVQSTSTGIFIKLILGWYPCVTYSLVQFLYIHWMPFPLNFLFIYVVFSRCRRKLLFNFPIFMSSLVQTINSISATTGDFDSNPLPVYSFTFPFQQTLTMWFPHKPCFW